MRASLGLRGAIYEARQNLAVWAEVSICRAAQHRAGGRLQSRPVLTLGPTEVRVSLGLAAPFPSCHILLGPGAFLSTTTHPRLAREAATSLSHVSPPLKQGHRTALYNLGFSRLCRGQRLKKRAEDPLGPLATPTVTSSLPQHTHGGWRPPLSCHPGSGHREPIWCRRAGGSPEPYCPRPGGLAAQPHNPEPS